MKNKIMWVIKNILFGFLLGIGVFVAVNGAEFIRKANWFERSSCHAYDPNSNELEILGYIPILDQKDFKYSYKIKNNTSYAYKKVRVELSVYKEEYLVATCSSTSLKIDALEERNVVGDCYSIIPENVTDKYKFEINVSSYQR